MINRYKGETNTRTKDETRIMSAYRKLPGRYVKIKEFLPKETVTCDVCRNEFEQKDITNRMCIKCSENLILLKDKHLQELKSMSKDDLINLIIESENRDDD